MTDFEFLLALLRRLFQTTKIKCDGERLLWIKELVDERMKNINNDPQRRWRSLQPRERPPQRVRA